MRRRRCSAWRKREGAADQVPGVEAVLEGGQRVQRAAAGNEPEDVVVRQAEEGRAQRREHGQAVGGVVDRAQDGGQRLHLLARVVLLASDQPVRDVALRELVLERADELGRHLADEQADVPGPGRADGVAAPVADAPRPLARDLVDERGDRFGDERPDRLHLAVVGEPVRGQRQRDRARALRGDLGTVGVERPRRGVFGLRKERVEALVHERQHRRHGAEVRGEGQDFAVGRLDQPLHLLVDRDVGAAEAVDALLGVADHEQLAGREADARPFGRGRRRGVFGQEERDLRLERVGVLELVHQDEVEPLLEVPADGQGARQHVARLEQQVGEVHDGALALGATRRPRGSRAASRAATRRGRRRTRQRRPPAHP